jgi:hypothetical protein
VLHHDPATRTLLSQAYVTLSRLSGHPDVSLPLRRLFKSALAAIDHELEGGPPHALPYATRALAPTVVASAADYDDDEPTRRAGVEAIVDDALTLRMPLKR